MADPEQPQQVELQLADSGRDLAAAVAAAQFARVVHHDPPASAADGAVIEGFVELFASAAEDWDELGTVARAGLLARLGEQVDALERRAWFVHWGTLRCGLARQGGGAVQLPLAILSISRSGLPVIRIQIPGTLSVDPGALH